MPRPQFSTTESQLKKREGEAKGRPGRKPRAAVEANPAQLSKPTPAGGSDLLTAMEAMKPLVESLGVEKVKRIGELLE